MNDTATVQPTATQMCGVIPYLDMMGKASDAADFYIRAFGATDLGRMPGETPGRLMHCQVEINGRAFMMCDHAPGPRPPMEAMHLQLVVDDGKAWWDRALKAGCTEVMAYQMQPWGDMWGMVRDPFGLPWAILQPGRKG